MKKQIIEQPLCYSCQKHKVKNSYSRCKSCEKKHKKQLVTQQEKHMRGDKVIRIMKCENCDGDSFRFVWEYDQKSEFNMIWCHDGFGFELDQADKICTKCGSKEDPNLESINDLFGKWINSVEGVKIEH